MVSKGVFNIRGKGLISFIPLEFPSSLTYIVSVCQDLEESGGGCRCEHEDIENSLWKLGEIRISIWIKRCLDRALRAYTCYPAIRPDG
mgnify:CR=1 FL=1